MSLRHGPIQASGFMMRRTGVMASEMVSRLSVVAPVENVMVAMGSGPSELFTAPQIRIPSGHRQATQVSVLRTMMFERDMRSLARREVRTHLRRKKQRRAVGGAPIP